MTLALCDPRRVLSWPSVYTSFMSLIGADTGMRRFARDVLRVRANERVLDLGCGPGRLFPHLPGTNYFGLDLDQSYLDRARRLYGNRFERVDLSADCSPFPERDFDLIVASGLLHHLSDSQACRVFSFCRERLRPGGRLVTLDGVIDTSQNPLSRWLVSIDRGGFVRTRQAYLDLASSAFETVEASVHHDLLRIPYSHAILVCVKQ
jgi:SAM-dependent methyltransferase